MRVLDCDIAGLKIVEPDCFLDSRGYFCEVWNENRYRQAGIDAKFVQDNESMSAKGVLRGLHWQDGEYAQAKLVRVVCGAVWDVAVDLRKGSPTFGKYSACLLSGENHRQFFIPRGFAHGFVVLRDNTVFSYKCDNFYHRPSERGIRFDDPDLAIEWPDCGVPFSLSEKDLSHRFFRELFP